MKKVKSQFCNYSTGSFRPMSVSADSNFDPIIMSTWISMPFLHIQLASFFMLQGQR